MRVWTFDVTVATHEELQRGRPEAQRYRITVVSPVWHGAFTTAYAMAARHGEVTSVRGRVGMDYVELRGYIRDTVTDLVSNFRHYDRKDDEYLSSDQLEEAISLGIVTVDEITKWFKEEMEK